MKRTRPRGSWCRVETVCHDVRCTCSATVRSRRAGANLPPIATRFVAVRRAMTWTACRPEGGTAWRGDAASTAGGGVPAGTGSDGPTRSAASATDDRAMPPRMHLRTDIDRPLPASQGVPRAVPPQGILEDVRRKATEARRPAGSHRGARSGPGRATDYPRVGVCPARTGDLPPRLASWRSRGTIPAGSRDRHREGGAVINLGLPAGALEVLCLGAHPDDVEIGCGGTLLRARRPRRHDGRRASCSPATPSARREAEAALRRRSSPARRSRCFDLPDGRLPAHWGEVKQALEDVGAGRSRTWCSHRGSTTPTRTIDSSASWCSTVWRDALVLHYEIPKWDGDLGSPTHYVAADRRAARAQGRAAQRVLPEPAGPRLVGRRALPRPDADARDGVPRRRYAEGFFATKVLLDLDEEEERDDPADPRRPATGSRVRPIDAAQARLHELVPGGAHTYARGVDQYPEDMAPVIARGRGARVEDVDGNTLRRVRHGPALGDARPRLRAGGRGRRAAIADGMNFSRPSGLELRGGRGLPRAGARRRHGEVRQERLRRHHGGGQAGPGRHRPRRWSRSAAASPSSPPTTGSSAPPPMDAGTLDEERRLTVGFDYNDLDSLRALLAAHPGEIACVILEAATALAEPAPGFLEGLRRARRRGRLRPGLRRDDHRHALVGRAAPSTSTASRPTCPPGARRWATASRSPRWRATRVYGARRPAHRRPAGLPAVHDARPRDGRAGRLPGGRSRPTGERDVVGEMERPGASWPRR